MTKKLGEKIKFLREKCKLSRKELGDMVGINQSQVWEFENRYFKNPSAPIISSIAKILNTSTEILVDDNQPIYEKNINYVKEAQERIFFRKYEKLNPKNKLTLQKIIDIIDDNNESS